MGIVMTVRMRLLMNIEVSYANPTKQALLTCELSKNVTVKDAIEKSGILMQFPEIDLGVNSVGIFGKKVSLETTLSEGDRVEIYRPLIIDPKEARRLRANKI